MRRSHWIAPAACLFAAGCYVSSTTLPAGLAPGQTVHLELNDGGSSALTPVLGPRALALDGRVLARTDSALDVAVTDITRIGGTEESWHGTTVTVPRSALGRTQTRRFSAVQTVLLAGAGVAALLLAGRALRGGDDLGTGARGGGETTGK